MVRRCFCVWLSVFTLSTCLSAGLGTVDEKVSMKRVPALHIEQFGAYNALAEISQKAGVAVGVSAVQNKESTITFDFPGGTVADLLNMFVSQVPDYAWEENDRGVFHVFRLNNRVSLVNVWLSYPGALKKTRKEIWSDITNRPEISNWLSTNGCTRGEIFTGNEFRDHNDPISIEAGSVTLEQLLDEVAVKSGVNYWAVLQSTSKRPCSVDIILW
jgi:hypothetical protein